jgi:hypothetical protein
MPSSARYSLATKQLVADLAARGHKVGCRAVEHWAELGLAPPAVRYSRGKHGFTSQYPPGATDQYAAVASVMRRGRDWRVAGLLLIGQGHVPARKTTFRFLLEFLFEDMDTTEDPLAWAEETISESAETLFSKRLIRLIKNNISSAQLIDPVTNKGISAESVAPGIMALILAAMLGDILPEGAAEEVAAAMGLIEPDLPLEERLERTKFAEAMLSGPLTFRELSKAAMNVEPACLQAAVVSIRKFLEENPQDNLSVFPAALVDLWMISMGLADIIIDDLGGLAWFRSMGIFKD